MTISLPPPSMDDQTYVPGETCSGLTAAHDGRDVRLYYAGRPPKRYHISACQGCVRGLARAPLCIELHEEKRSDPARADRGPGAHQGPLMRRLRALVA